MEAIGVYVRTLRDQRGFTQEGLAALVGISEKTMRNLESGRHDPKIETLAQIVDDPARWVLPSLPKRVRGRYLLS